jgi:hypothetical protein
MQSEDMRHADCDGLTRTSCKTFDICRAREPGMASYLETNFYQPVAWWFTKRRLGRELRNLYQAIEEKLPPQFACPCQEIRRQARSSVEGKSEGGDAAATR